MKEKERKKLAELLAEPVLIENVDILADGRHIRLREDMLFDLAGAGFVSDKNILSPEYVVPAGFVTDCASVPRVFWVLFPPWGRYSRAAVLHDYLYRTPNKAQRKEADRLFRYVMKQSGVKMSVRNIFYVGVRGGGRSSYEGPKEDNN